MADFRIPAATAIAAALLLAGIAPSAASCAGEVGERRAERYVEDCLAVSAATHPPCNVENSCSLILGEIARSCRQIGDGDPGSRECRRYR